MRAQLAAFRVLRQITKDQAYAHIAINDVLAKNPDEAALITELVYGTTRAMGTYDQIIAVASGRRLKDFQPAVVDMLRLGAHQLLQMRTPPHAAINETVAAAAKGIGPRVKGVVNAILRKIANRDFVGWIAKLSDGKTELETLALRTCHPTWIVEKYAELLPAGELEVALLANNQAPVPTLVIRPGLLSQAELLRQAQSVNPEAEITKYAETGVKFPGNPELIEAVKTGRAGVQDEGSQLLVLLAVAVAEKYGLTNWLDMCAGPGGKAALLQGLVPHLTCNEIQPHRAELVKQALRAYPQSAEVVTGDGRQIRWPKNSFDAVLLDAPCSGLGALRRRPDARWRKDPQDLAELVPLQLQLAEQALEVIKPGGLLCYATCSPVAAETTDVVAKLQSQHHLDLIDLRLFDRWGLGLESMVMQLWPYRYGTDAMFLAVLRKLG